MMNDATMQSQYNPGRSPLLGLAAIVATAATLGIAVLLPAQHLSEARVAAARPADAQSTIQVVVLPAVEVVGTRETQSAENNRGTLPVVFKKNG
jgi:hypothetical protein